MRIKKYKLFEERGHESLKGFHHVRYRFPNGYGASVVCGKYSYGVELAVLKFGIYDFEIDYTTPITDDVLGYLNYREFKKALEDIYNLPRG